MRIYYLDEPLSVEDMMFLRESLAQREGLRSFQEMEQVRIPMVLPTPGKDGHLEQSIEEQMVLLQRSLQNAGIEQEVGNQIVFVMPKETHWGAKIQMAIMDLTGIGPYTVQRWSFDEEGNLVQRNTRVIDTHGMFGGKE